MVMERASRFGSREVFRYKMPDRNELGSWSWEYLYKKAQNISRSLISLGFGYDDKLGIFSDNRPEWVMTDLGILGVRGVVVPFYATSSKQQLKYIIDETKMRLLFVGNKEQYEKALWLLDNTETIKKIVVFDSGIAPNSDSCIDLNTFLNLVTENQFSEEHNRLIEAAQTEDLATIIYTSGTTGEPKGVMLEHATFFQCFRIHDQRLEVNENDVSACFLPLSHVFERAWTYYMLYCGTINGFVDNPREIIAYLPLIKPSFMCTVPRFFEKTFEGIEAEAAKWPSIKRKIFSWSVKVGHVYSGYKSKNERPPLGNRIKHFIADKLVLRKLRNIFGGRIKFMPCAGAAISPKLLKFFHAADIFINYGYGATETTATVACFKSDTYDFETCGTVMPEVYVKISDEGEILIKGKTIFKGYYNKPEETSKTLIDGWYHSGDKGYLKPNDGLVMVDRIKDLIKTSVGKYVSPQKVELLLCQDSLIDQVAVIGDDRKYITALIVPSFENLKREAIKMGIETHDHLQLVHRKEIIDLFKERIERAQEELTSYEKVVKFILLPEPFSIQNGALTNTLKVKRKMLIERHKDEIDKMYLAG